MNRLESIIKSFVQEEDGAVVTEYGMLIVIVVLAMAGVLVLFKNKVRDWFSSIGDNLANVENAAPAAAAP
jgi:Flp pilus assembly pilin Flp